MLQTTMHDVAMSFLDQIKELPGNSHNPFVQWCHSLCGLGPDQPDEVPWCSSFMNAIALIARLPRSRSAAARSWLVIGAKVELPEAQVGNDVVVLQRGSGVQPGPEDLNAPGHVGLFSGSAGGGVWVLGGNQSNSVTRQWFPESKVLGVRRLGGLT